MAEETQTQETQPTAEKKSETNEVFIGNKPFMKYVTATMMQLENNQSAVIKARGKFISRGVDVAEVSKKRYQQNQNADLKQAIQIGTDSFKNDEGKDISVSTIDISLNK